MRQLLSVQMACLLAVMTTLTASTDARAAVPLPAGQEDDVKNQVLGIPAGSRVQVSLKSKEKLRGQLGTVTNEGFTMKTIVGSTIEDKEILFSQVKSVKQIGKGHSPAFWVLIGVGAFLAVCGAIAATHYGGQ